MSVEFYGEPFNLCATLKQGNFWKERGSVTFFPHIESKVKNA